MRAVTTDAYYRCTACGTTVPEAQVMSTAPAIATPHGKVVLLPTPVCVNEEEHPGRLLQMMRLPPEATVLLHRER